MPVRSRAEYVRLAEDALVALVRKEGAVLMREAEAKISDTRWPQVPVKINPHHVSTARANLLKRGWITLSDPIDESGTRLLLPADQKGRKTEIDKAVKRRTALQKRMERWARPSDRHPNGLIGEAGERVTRRSLGEAVQTGLVRPVNPAGAEVVSVLGGKVPGGPLDSGAWIDELDQLGRATGGSVLCPIEVKNIRHWIYPRSHELFQLLYKAARLQEAAPDADICPILVTRERAQIVNSMSHDLGFRIFDLHKQFVLPLSEVPEEDVQDIHDELGYTDLTRSQDSDPLLVKLFSGSMRKGAAKNAAAWNEFGSQLTDHYKILRDPGLPDKARSLEMEHLRADAEAIGAWSGVW